MAIVPVAPTLSTLTSAGFKIDVNSDGNPSGTFYSFRVVANTVIKFVDALGQLQDTEIFLNVTTLTLTDGAPNTLHAVDLKAADDAAGLNASIFGPSASATTLAAFPAPKSFAATFSTTTISSWGANDNPDGTEYEVQLSPDMNFISGVLTSGFITTLGHIFNNLIPSTLYYGRVKARNLVLAETAFVSLGSTTTLVGPDTVKVIRVRDMVSERGFLIDWQPNVETDIAGYNVYRSGSPTDSSAFDKLNSTLIPTNIQSYLDNIPYTFGVVWYYKVTAVDNGGNESSLDLTTPVHDNTFHSFEEQPFPTTVTKNDFVVDELPEGAINDANVLYTVKFPFIPGTLEVFSSGIRMRHTLDYNEGPLSQQFTFLDPPDTGGDLRVNYIKI